MGRTVEGEHSMDATVFIVAAVLAWLVASTTVALVIGGMIRRRDDAG